MQSEVVNFSGCWRVAGRPGGVMGSPLDASSAQSRPGRRGNTPHKRSSKEPVSQRDLAEMVTQPLASRVNEPGLQILQEIRKVLDSLEISARQTARDLQEGK
jgi:hypothetical protein